MIAYFKYTQGGTFTLKGDDYIGSFNVINGTAYTGTVYTPESQALTPSNTFTAAIYLEQGEFDRTVDSTINLSHVNVNPRDILNFTTLQTLISSLDYNNKALYKTAILISPDTVNFKNVPADNLTTKFYGLSSTVADIHVPKDTISGKRTYTQIDPFSFSPEWAFMDEAIGSSLFVNPDESFLYFVSTKNNVYTLSGSIYTDSPLVLVNSLYHGSNTNYIQNDLFNPNTLLKQNNVLNYLYEIGTDTILVYDLKTFKECGSKILIDSLKVYDKTKYYLNDGNKKFIKIGRKLRGALLIEDTTRVLILDLKNSQSNEDYIAISLKDLNLATITCFDIREQDDALIVVGQRTTGLWMLVIDTSLLIKGSVANAIVYEDMLLYADDMTDISFSKTDSNIFTIDTKTNIQTRFLSNPKTPASVLDMTFTANPENLLYLRNYTFNNTHERFDQILIKYNSNKLRSNYPNLVCNTSVTTDTAQYIAIQFIGRLYIFKNKVGVDYATNNLLPTDLVKYNNNVVDCSNSYLGITLNNNLYNIVSDTLNIYNNYSRQVTKGFLNDIPLLIKSRGRTEILSIDSLNFSLHENESVNVLSLQRAFGAVYNLQTAIASSILSGIN